MMLSALWTMLVVSMTAVDGVSAGTGIITVARCRSRCLAKFVSNKDREGGCQKSTCKECWTMCYDLVSDYDMWRDTCRNKKLCKRGCQYACEFNQILSNKSTADPWTFTEIPSVVPLHDRRKAYIAWHQPVMTNDIPDVKNRSKPNFVYVLLTSDTDEKAWKEIEQTSSTEAVVQLDDLPKSPQFWLLAVLESGTVANKRFKPPTNIHWPFEDTIEISGVNGLKEGVEVNYESDSTLNLTFEMHVVDGRMRPRVSWQNPSDLPKKRRLEYQLTLSMNDCDGCGVPSDYYPFIVPVDINKQPIKEFEHLEYSAEYHVAIQLLGHDKWHGEMTFFTPKCYDKNITDSSHCLSAVNNVSTIFVHKTDPPPPLTTMEMLIDGTAAPVIASNGDEPCNTILDWNITLINRKYDVKTERVSVSLKWSLPFSHSRVRQTLVWSNINHKQHVDADDLEVNNTWRTLQLKPYSEYRVTVVAKYLDEQFVEREECSRELIVSTNVTDNMPVVTAASMDDKREIVRGMIVGGTIVSSLLIIAIILVCIYKKRHKFRDIMITKTAVAKSNSYKSNVGCKVDYSNQMLITSDDWEIDCRQLKFASHIGEGAFGKVVTGYYDDHRVAIKLIRDCAPISYKEDLLAEISLMKRIGSHPNIVSMIGACTLVEPICLVMEYVPYGNLQNFLKKCRLEGELTVEAGKNPEINYSIMDEHGGINEGVVTPADLLSFARQVAMAMEYLEDKRYVHRDLAARNVLLGNDKIIKVCDFGLSRDIFNDNQYKKLTNGKLPLKWMAIESLRDRVFTTQSDVWSFGILMWEIVTMGASPYPSIALADLYYLLSNNYRMEKPSNCSDELYLIMRECWMETPTDRPTFTDLRVQLEVFLTRDRNYLDLDNINVPLSTPESSSGSPVEDDTKSLLAAQALQPQRKSSKDEMTVNVSIHDKNVEKFLKRKSDLDSHNITIL